MYALLIELENYEFLYTQNFSDVTWLPDARNSKSLHAGQHVSLKPYLDKAISYFSSSTLIIARLSLITRTLP